jgi:hypothetical protein
MARIRTIKPEFWQNEQLASLTQHARLLAIALLNQSDDKGYFLANHQLVRAACFPFEEDSKNVLGSLQELSRIGYIEVRNCGGKQVGWICKFLDHQRIDKPQKSKLEDVFAENYEQNDDSKTIPRTFLECSMISPRLEWKGKEQGKEMERISSEAGKQPSKQFDPASCCYPIFPACGEPPTWEATERQIAEWSAAYPAVDVGSACRRAHAWVMANLTKRKTAKGYPKFLNGWLARTQDKTGSPAVTTTAPRQRSFTT